MLLFIFLPSRNTCLVPTISVISYGPVNALASLSPLRVVFRVLKRSTFCPILNLISFFHWPSFLFCNAFPGILEPFFVVVVVVVVIYLFYIDVIN